MLSYSDLTVFKNTDGIATALGYPINSFLLQNNKSLFVGGGKKKGNAKKTDYDYENQVYENQAYENQAYENQAYENQAYENLAVPAGLVCMTETICTRADGIGQNEIDQHADEIVPEGLYERLMELAETKPSKKMTKRKHPHAKKHKTHKHKTQQHKK
jgi:hypothetical protein